MDIGLFIFADLFAVLTGAQSGILREILIEETFVMIADQPGNFVDRQIATREFQHFARLRHLQAQELVALAILTGPRLEKPHQLPPLLLVA